MEVKHDRSRRQIRVERAGAAADPRGGAQLAMHVEGNAPTPHAIAHAVARAIELDDLRIAEQLEAAGVQLERGDVG